MSEVKQYAERYLLEMDRAGDFYGNHVMAMTAEQLHSKSDIAAELGWRDMQIANLKEQLTATTNSLTNAQEALKSAGIEADTVQAGVMELVDKLRIKQNHIKLRETYILELEQRAEAAEAKLAELEKQEPVGTVSIAMDWNTHRNVATVNMRPDLVVAEMKNGDELFTRPEPAIDLNAVRAEGVDYVAEAIGAKCAELKFGSKDWKALKSVVFTLTSFAAQLRAGNAGKDGV